LYSYFPASLPENRKSEVFLMGMEQDIQQVLFSEEELKSRVQALGAQITRDYAGKDKILLVSVLRGSYIFMADLSRAIDLPLTVDFMSVSSYGSGTRSSGQVEIKKDISMNLDGYHVIIVEDILDSGNTLYYLMEILKLRKAASISICTLLDKPDRRAKPITANYAGFTVPDAFVVGYGLDYDQKYRNLPYIGILKPEVYAKED
jgi:hypoxanthine phosphoribosyltransferase